MLEQAGRCQGYTPSSSSGERSLAESNQIAYQIYKI